MTTPPAGAQALAELADTIERLEKSATPGEWVWQTGSSWTRLGTATGRCTDGSVICPFVNQYDRHPDLSVSNADAELIVALRNNAPALVAALRALADMRGVLERTAMQLTTAEMDAGDLIDADFEGAYDIMIGDAREALARSAP